MARNLQSKKNRQSQKVLTLALMGVVTFGAVAQTFTQVAAIASTPSTQTTIAQRNQSPRSATTRLPQRVVQRVRRDAVERFNLTRRNLSVVNYSRETWPDSCLGLARDNERCAMATVEGWRIEITNGQQNWVYRTDLNAQVIKLETQDTASLPAQVVDRLFEAIAREARVPANTLKLIESQPATWDGCMGIFEPGRACTRIAISGYRVIVMGERQSWVYHVSQDASRIVQNATASGSGVSITPSFVPSESGYPTPGEDVVFQMTLTGGFAPMTTETVLTSDGTVYRKTIGMRGFTGSESTVIKRLSPQQLQQFQQLLQQQRFPNLNNVRYLTSAALADYPTTVLQGMDSTVAYIDLEKDSLPQSLQTVVQAWERLLQ